MNSKSHPIIVLVASGLLFLTVSCFSSENELPKSEKTLLKAVNLKFHSGFKIPKIKINGKHHAPAYLDLLPASKRWVSGHKVKYIIEYIEPESFNGRDVKDWPYLKVVQKLPVMSKTDKIRPFGVYWLNDSEILTSGRKSYRSGYEQNWMYKLNLKTGKEYAYDINQAKSLNLNNFNVLQALGGGFVRLSNRKWADKYAYGANFLLGRGGYDVLGSPLGPAMGYWDMSNESAEFLLYYPTNSPARRDPSYYYPQKDPNTSTKSRLKMWQEPDAGGGYWQAGDVGGITQINHTSVHGFLITKNQGRGLHDYRSQGDEGSGKFFMVANPAKFYSPTGKGNRGKHRNEPLNGTYPNGSYARLGLMVDEQQLAEVQQGKRAPNQVTFYQFDWPKEGIPWRDRGRNPTLLGSVTWDDHRQLLWLVLGTNQEKYLVAYKIIVPNS